MTNPYWRGGRKAVLSRDQIRAPWGSGDHSGSSIRLVNTAFDLYYQAMRNIVACPDGHHSFAMQRQLQSAARTGSWFGISNLAEAFEHLESTGGIWTDDDTSNYYPGREKAYYGHGGPALVRAPTSVVNFMDAIDSGLTTLREALRDWESGSGRLAAMQPGRRRMPPSDWERIGELVGGVHSWGERAMPFMWRAPALQQHLGRTVGFANALSQIHGGLTTYADGIRAGAGERQAVAIGALRAVVGFVPVLGGFYGKAVEAIPGLVGWFRGLLQDRRRRFDAAAWGRG